MISADLPSALRTRVFSFQRKKTGLGAGEGFAQDPEAPTCQVFWAKVHTSLPYR